MADLLADWVEQNRSRLEALGFKVALSTQHVGGCHSVDLDSSSVVGGIAHWAPAQFEFHFMSCATGDVLVLEEQSFSSSDELSAFFEELWLDKLSSEF